MQKLNSKKKFIYLRLHSTHPLLPIYWQDLIHPIECFAEGTTSTRSWMHLLVVLGLLEPGRGGNLRETDLTSPSSLILQSTTLPKGHSFLFADLLLIRTTSPSPTQASRVFHLCLLCKVVTYSHLHLCQKDSAKNCTFLYLNFPY